MVESIDFDSIRPFEDDEIHEVFERLKNEMTFLELIHFLYPGFSTEEFLNQLLNIKSIRDFQFQVVYPYVKEIIKNTTTGVTSSGIENLDPGNTYLFISNHRDIVLDSAILNILLVDHGFETTEIAIGDNLLIFPWITDLVKLNRSFIVNRNLPARQMMESSTRLSAYIRHTLNTKKRSIWIAQREGRSKDGDDRTQVSLLKMLNISGQNDIIQNFKELRIVPVSISYEYDPCDYLKAFEFQQKRDNQCYKKTPKDDLRHMGTGLKGWKGRVHFSFGTPILEELSGIEKINSKNDQLAKIAELIDMQIHKNYQLWPGNYIAYEYCGGPLSLCQSNYSSNDKETFIKYIREHMTRIHNGDSEFIFDTLMEMYANPVRNHE